MLYIASNSQSRKKLLQHAGIPYQIIHQDADETLISHNQPVHQIVMSIACLKMEQAQIPDGTHESELCFVLTADTLGKASCGRILTKPSSKADAMSMLRDARHGSVTVTGFCLKKLQWQGGAWRVLDELIDYDETYMVFDVPEEFVQFYLSKISFMQVSGAISIEEVGGQFLKNLDGNYENVVGLPMFKIRHALYSMGFYDQIKASVITR